MKTIKQLLDNKGREVYSIGPNASVLEALSVLAEKGIGALVVVEENRIIGMFSERDYARNIILKDRKSEDTLVREVMVKRVIYASPDQTVEECMALVTEKRVRHLPVLENNTIVGIVSIGDLVKSIIADQKFIIDQLVHYITQ